MKGLQLNSSPLTSGVALRVPSVVPASAASRRSSVRTFAAADRPLWLPDKALATRAPIFATITFAESSLNARGADLFLFLARSKPPQHLDGSLPADFGFDPLGLGGDPEFLKWAAESERVHSRWAMLAVAGILAQEIVRPDIFWYDAPVKIQLPFNIIGLVAFELFAMHYVETKRGLDLQKPGSQDTDPLFPNNKLPKHDVGYPGGIFAPFVPGNLEELKVKELKNGRLAMLAFAGFVMSAQVTGVGPLAALQQHINDPINTTIFSKAAVVPGAISQPPCAIEPTHNFQGLNIPTPCFLRPLWP